jgi:hypothetical protein
LKAYLAHRNSPDETFLTFARRHDGETLRKLADARSPHEPDDPAAETGNHSPSAPFSEAQRSWLNGFFAGLLSTDGPTAVVGGAGRRRPARATAMTAKRRGTTRPCRSPIA